MESLGLEDFQAGTARMERGEKKETLEHRALLDPGVGGSLTSGGAEQPAQTQRELNSSTLEQPRELNIARQVEQVTISVCLTSQNTYKPPEWSSRIFFIRRCRIPTLWPAPKHHTQPQCTLCAVPCHNSRGNDKNSSSNLVPRYVDPGVLWISHD